MTPFGLHMHEIDSTLVRAVDRQLIDRYSMRLTKFGDDPRTLGWDKRESQNERFRIAKESVDFTGRSILDVGCGLANLKDYLTENNIHPSSYSGCDINGDLLELCRNRHPNSLFYQANLIVDDVPGGPFDIVTLFGVVNFRFKEFSNEDFARVIIRRAFDQCREALLVDMLSAEADAQYTREDFVYYYDPVEMLRFALSITPHVLVRHDYRSIPQREMMFVLKRRL
jgi:SAM-dependent methyltransferase